MTKTSIACGIFFLSALLAPPAATAQESPGPKAKGKVTALQVPRYVSLKASEVNSRVGPGSEYQIAWVFKRAGLPVEVLDEFETWRQIRDSDGGTGWVAAALLSARRTAAVAPWVKERISFPLTTSKGGSAEAARVEPGAIVDIQGCDGEACEVYAGNQKGWIAQKNLWGVYPGETVK
jgi:SH3-like domain-containing protein